MSRWYQELFRNYANNYDKENFTQGTLGEVDFLENELNHDKTKNILDIGCGTGRHAIELARRGYRVTGVDLSENQLNRAREKAKEAGVEVDFQAADARELSFLQEFDLAMMICEGAFPLMETDEMNFLILKNAVTALKPGGKLIFTTLSALFPLFHSVKDFINANSTNGVSQINTFDLMTFRDHSILTFTDDRGESHTLECNERYYTPSEIEWLLKSLGMSDIALCGCELGKFNRAKILTPQDYEILAISRKL